MDPAPPRSLPDLNADPPAEAVDLHGLFVDAEPSCFPELNAEAEDDVRRLDGLDAEASFADLNADAAEAYGDLDGLDEDHLYMLLLGSNEVRCRKRLRASEDDVDGDARGAPRLCYDDVANVHADEEMLRATEDAIRPEEAMEHQAIGADSAAAEEGGAGRPVLLELFPRSSFGEADQRYTHDQELGTPAAQESSGEQIAEEDTYYDNDNDNYYYTGDGGAYEEDHHLPGSQQHYIQAQDYVDGGQLSAEYQHMLDFLSGEADGECNIREQEQEADLAAAQQTSGEQIAAEDTYYNSMARDGSAYAEEHHLPGGQQQDMAAAQDYIDGEQNTAEYQHFLDFLSGEADGEYMAAAQGSVEHVSEQQYMFQLLSDEADREYPDPHLQEAAMAAQDCGEYMPLEMYEPAAIPGNVDEENLQLQEQGDVAALGSGRETTLDDLIDDATEEPLHHDDALDMDGELQDDDLDEPTVVL